MYGCNVLACYLQEVSVRNREAQILSAETNQNVFLILVQEKTNRKTNEYLDDVAVAIKRTPCTSALLDRNRHDTREFAQFLTTAAAAAAQNASPTTYDQKITAATTDAASCCVRCFIICYLK